MFWPCTSLSSRLFTLLMILLSLSFTSTAGFSVLALLYGSIIAFSFCLTILRVAVFVLWRGWCSFSGRFLSLHLFRLHLGLGRNTSHLSSCDKPFFPRWLRKRTLCHYLVFLNHIFHLWCSRISNTSINKHLSLACIFFCICPHIFMEINDALDRLDFHNVV